MVPQITPTGKGSPADPNEIVAIAWFEGFPTEHAALDQLVLMCTSLSKDE